MLILAATSILATACDDGDSATMPQGHGPIAEDISAPMGEPVPYATAEQRETFERGEAVSLRRFDVASGLGPAFNVTFCTSCHERPTPGGSAGLYRNFAIAGQTTSDGVFIPATSAGVSGGVVRLYLHNEDGWSRPPVAESTNTFGQRNPIPFFGVGLIAELDEAVILEHADPEDEDGDGVSGRPNYDQGFVGRFGRKAQTVSIEGFIRGPLFNHLGITTDPLSEAQKAALPIDSSMPDALRVDESDLGVLRQGQAAAPSEPLFDDDDAPDPELSSEDLFDLVSFAMLMAAPQLEPETPRTKRGATRFDEAGCDTCHTPRLVGPRGPLPIYSDLLLHDMGPQLADGIPQGVATGAEFRTQPLWGIAAVGPYLHDGRAETIADAIEWHAGEAKTARDRFAAMSEEDQGDLIEFLMSLGGRDQYSQGLLPRDAPLPAPGAYGGPRYELSADEEAAFLAGRALFDREFGHASGIGQPRFNGDSCRACHFEPVIGGAGPRGVNVMRHGIVDGAGEFIEPTTGTILHRQSALIDHINRPQAEANIFEPRQTPHLFGLGLIESIPDEMILAGADPADLESPDGISGKPSWTDGGRLGRFGWKGQVPSIAEFVRDAVTAELGMTIEAQPGLTFGRIQDNDDVADPEFSADEAEQLALYLRLLAPPPRQMSDAPDSVERGEAVFEEVGCAACHIPALEGPDGPVPLYSDLLLHEILPPDAVGIEDASANMREFRTPPLWGLSQTAPYLHTGAADTVSEAVSAHDGEAANVRDAYLALPDVDRDALLEFLETL